MTTIEDRPTIGTMLRIRRFEERIEELYRAGELPGFVHLSIGQEACAAGACAALRRDDYITSTHRGRGHCIAKGADTRKMMAELYAKATGVCKGKGGSMHIADFSVGMLGANGVVGGGPSLAVAAAMCGARPVVDMHFADFVATAMDEVVNQAAKMRYMFGGQAKVPMVLRMPDGAIHSAPPTKSSPRPLL